MARNWWPPPSLQKANGPKRLVLVSARQPFTHSSMEQDPMVQAVAFWTRILAPCALNRNKDPVNCGPQRGGRLFARPRMGCVLVPTVSRHQHSLEDFI